MVVVLEIFGPFNLGSEAMRKTIHILLTMHTVKWRSKRN